MQSQPRSEKKKEGEAVENVVVHHAGVKEIEDTEESRVLLLLRFDRILLRRHHRPAQAPPRVHLTMTKAESALVAVVLEIIEEKTEAIESERKKIAMEFQRNMSIKRVY